MKWVIYPIQAVVMVMTAVTIMVIFGLSYINDRLNDLLD